MMPDGVRAFVALTLASEVEQAVADFVESMKTAGAAHRDSLRWTARGKLHLTLRFLGDGVAAATLERLANALEKIADATAPFAIEVNGLGAFPNLSRPDVIWLGLESDELAALAQQVECAAVAAGLAPERRAFAPHLTIARVRHLTRWAEMRRELERAKDRNFGRTLARSLILYRSILRRDSRYEELGHYDFARGA